jgi:colicin import membrane protein
MSAATADNFIADNWKYLLVATALHVAVGAAMVIGIERAPKAVQPATLAIKATIVDNSAQRLQRERDEAARKAREQAEAERAAREQADLAAMLEAEEQRKTEQRVQEQRAEEQRRAQVVEQQRKAEQQRKDEQARQAAAQRAEQEKKRLAEIKAKQEAQAKAARDAREQAQREAELKRQLADEEGRMQAENSGLLNQYVALIQQHVIRNWRKPASARPGTQCDVKVTQAPGGTVLSVEINRCNGDDAVRQSIEDAVHRASPLPPPPDARLFQRVIVFVFKPTE